MSPYFFMVGIPAFMSAIFYYSHKKRSVYNFETNVNEIYAYKKTIDTFFVIWLLLLFLRSETVGSDIPIYKEHFIKFSNIPWNNVLHEISSDNLEPAYYLICKIVSCCTNNFRGVIIITTLISVVPIWILYRENGKSGYLTIVLFLNIAPFAMYFSGLRQAMALAFSVPCYYFCKKKKFWRFIIIVILAYMFHKSSIVLVLMYPFYHFRLRNKIHLFYLLPLTAVFYIFKIPIFKFFLLLMNDKYIERYSDGIRLTGAYTVLILLVVLLLYSYLLIDEDKLDNDTIGLRNFLIIAVFLQVFSGAHSIAMRMNYYYLIFIPLIIERVIQIGNNRHKEILQLSKICMIAFFTIYYFYFAYTDRDILNVYPYHFFWENVL